MFRYTTSTNPSEDVEYSFPITDADLEKLYKNSKTSKGNTIMSCNKLTRTIDGDKFPRVPDKECYDVFGLYFEGLATVQMDYNSGLDLSCEIMIGTADLLEDISYPPIVGKEIKHCEIVIRRNLKKYEFSPSLSLQESQAMEQFLKKNVEEIIEQEGLKSVPAPQYWVNLLNEEFVSYKSAFPSYTCSKLLYTVKFSTEKDSSIIGIAINYGDHLQILGCINKGNLGQLYIDTTCIYKLLADRLEFAKHPVYGYLTSPMEYLGSGISVELWLKLPLVGKLPGISTYLEDYNVHAMPEDSEFELVKLRTDFTLNGSEPEGFVNIALAAHLLTKELEPELVETTPKALKKEIMPCESLERLSNIICKSNICSYTKKFLTSYQMEIYFNTTTKYFGTFGHCIRINAICNETLYPRACDPTAYTVFSKFFNLILQDHNKISVIDHPNYVDYGQASGPPIAQATSYVLSHMVRFVRNLKDYPFSPLLFKRERAEIEKLLVESVSKLNGVYYPFEALLAADNKTDDDFIAETMLRIQDDPVRENIGAHRDWPNSRGVFKVKCQNPDIALYIFINDVDQLKVKCIDLTGDNLEEMYTEASNVMKHFDSDKTISFAKKRNYGFLTSSLKDTGTGMTLSSWIHLPYLNSDRNKLAEVCKLKQLSYQSRDGKGFEVENSIFQINSNASLGHSEIRQFCQYTIGVEALLLEEIKVASNERGR